ncbi:MAG: hypothetical protein AVDCRST_MAG49-2850, partial [uncultured Thermomicrobiales bacterium]
DRFVDHVRGRRHALHLHRDRQLHRRRRREPAQPQSVGVHPAVL